MEQIEFDYPSKRKVSKKAHVGVVGSGDLEVLLEPTDGERSQVFIQTSVDGFQ
jgi:malonate decarboxylase delta subunit